MSTEITLLLDSINAGDDEAKQRLLSAVYADLKSMAGARLGHLPPGQTLQPTALVHEAYIKLLGKDASFENRAHFFGAAARAMRNILVDLARKKASVKHGGEARRLGLDVEVVEAETVRLDRVLDIDAALEELAAEDERAARVVELRYFASMTEAEAAVALNVSERTVRRDWTFAKAWLKGALDEGDQASERSYA